MASGLPLLTSRSNWDRARARHLLNRAGFGIPQSAVDVLLRLGPEGAVDTFLQYERYPDNLPAPDDLPAPMSYRDLRALVTGKSKTERREFRKQMQRHERKAIEELQVWWFKRMLNTNRPLVEKMALFWHGHFATSASKVKSAAHNYQLNQVFRTQGLGNFRTLVLEMGKSPAMLRYLDNQQNRKGRANENFSRELMELFTLGLGNYTEKDVKESARAFTGWTTDGRKFVFDRRRHDDGVKTFLGHTGRFTGDDIVDIILDQPACPRFIARKIWEHFVYTNPDERTIDALAEVFRGAKYEIRPLLKTIFLSEAFYSDRAMASQIKSPAQLMAGLVDHLGLYDKVDAARGRLLIFALRSMDQDLFMPPNVKGWPGNRAWINTNTLLIRYNLGARLVNGERAAAAHRPQMPAHADERNRQILRRFAARQAAEFRRAPFDAQSFFAPYDGMPLNRAVDAMAGRLLCCPLDSRQRALLMDTVRPGARPDDPLVWSTAEESHLRGAVHLLLSMAEYQLC